MNTEVNGNLVKAMVIGVGGGGNNAVNRMIEEKVQNIEFGLMNTEAGFIKRAKTKNILQIGKDVTKGLGAGADPYIGEKAALENKEEIKKILNGTDILFVTAGMGGGTGTGAAPVVAELAKEMGILTVGIVTKPFTFEGRRRAARADMGIEKMRNSVNALIVVLNNQLLKVASHNIAMTDAFHMADDVLKQGIQSITDLITKVGDINIDFADVRTIMSYKGKAYMGIGEAEGENRLVDAVKEAIQNPLTETKIDRAKGVIFHVTGGEDLGLNEVNNGIALVNDKIDAEANIIFGTSIDESYKDKVKVTVIATGIEENSY